MDVPSSTFLPSVLQLGASPNEAKQWDGTAQGLESRLQPVWLKRAKAQGDF
jgi:hypothetical protein